MKYCPDSVIISDLTCFPLDYVGIMDVSHNEVNAEIRKIRDFMVHKLGFKIVHEVDQTIFFLRGGEFPTRYSDSVLMSYSIAMNGADQVGVAFGFVRNTYHQNNDIPVCGVVRLSHLVIEAVDWIDNGRQEK